MIEGTVISFLSKLKVRDKKDLICQRVTPTFNSYFVRYLLLPPAYVVRREGNSFTLLVCPHLRGGGGLPISHNALQHYPECHGADTWGGGGGVPISNNALQHYPEFHGVDTWGGYPARSSWGGIPCWGVPCPGVPCRGGTLPGGYPTR